jgi:hypothetical protein
MIKCAVPTELNQIMNVITPELNFGATICTEPTALLKNSELTLKSCFSKKKNPNTRINIRLPYICHIIFYKKSLV